VRARKPRVLSKEERALAKRGNPRILRADTEMLAWGHREEL